MGDPLAALRAACTGGDCTCPRAAGIEQLATGPVNAAAVAPCGSRRASRRRAQEARCRYSHARHARPTTSHGPVESVPDREKHGEQHRDEREHPRRAPVRLEAVQVSDAGGCRRTSPEHCHDERRGHRHVHAPEPPRTTLRREQAGDNGKRRRDRKEPGAGSGEHRLVDAESAERTLGSGVRGEWDEGRRSVQFRRISQSTSSTPRPMSRYFVPPWPRRASIS